MTAPEAPEQYRTPALVRKLVPKIHEMLGKGYTWDAIAQMMADGHRQAIAMVNAARVDAKPEMRSFLDGLLPVLQRHEDMANDILIERE